MNWDIRDGWVIVSCGSVVRCQFTMNWDIRDRLMKAKRTLEHRLQDLLPVDLAGSELLIGLCRRLVAADPDKRFPDAEAADLGRRGAAAFHRQWAIGAAKAVCYAVIGTVWGAYGYFTELDKKEEVAFVAILRDILGNPFNPVTINPKWLTSTVVSLAQQMYDSRDFSAMPILADALQDSGCSNEDILNHCRGPGPHVRGCWVCDLCLGKG